MGGVGLRGELSGGPASLRVHQRALPRPLWRPHLQGYIHRLRRQEAIVKVSLRVSPPQNTGLKLVMSHIGGGFRSSGGAGGRGVPSEGCAIAA